MSTPEPTTENTKLLRRPSWKAALCILLSSYVISIGPTAWVIGEQFSNPHCLASRFWHSFYAPILRICDSSPPLKSLLKSYIELFSGLA